MGIVGFTPNMDTVIKIRQYQRVVQWKEGILFKDLSGFDHNTNTFRNFSTYVLYMCRPFQIIVNDHSKKFGFFYL